jgi:hypothetical protein
MRIPPGGRRPMRMNVSLPAGFGGMAPENFRLPAGFGGMAPENFRLSAGFEGPQAPYVNAYGAAGPAPLLRQQQK